MSRKPASSSIKRTSPTLIPNSLFRASNPKGVPYRKFLRTGLDGLIEQLGSIRIYGCLNLPSTLVNGNAAYADLSNAIGLK